MVGLHRRNRHRTARRDPAGQRQAVRAKHCESRLPIVHTRRVPAVRILDVKWDRSSAVAAPSCLALVPPQAATHLSQIVSGLIELARAGDVHLTLRAMRPAEVKRFAAQEYGGD